MNQFEHYLGIDYSGKGLPTQRHTSIQIFEADRGGGPVSALGRSSWSRRGVFEYLAERLGEQRTGGRGRMIVGLDHGLSFPLSYFREVSPGKPKLTTWLQFLEHFDRLWGGCRERPVSAIAATLPPYPNPTLLRLSETFTSSAKSVLNLNPTLISVAFSTHAGLPWIRDLRRQFGDVAHFWPYDGIAVPAHKSVFAEVYPSLLYNRYTYPARLTRRDQRDAYAAAQWLKEQDESGALRHYLGLPTLTQAQLKEIVPLEGWILGVL